VIVALVEEDNSAEVVVQDLQTTLLAGIPEGVVIQVDA
jgi:hypothetical protein